MKMYSHELVSLMTLYHILNATNIIDQITIIFFKFSILELNRHSCLYLYPDKQVFV